MELEDLLCDACLYKVENDPSTLVADMCDRCRAKVLQWLLDTAEELEGMEE
jgi:hypothetical protein